MTCIGTLCCSTCATSPGFIRAIQVRRSWVAFQTFDCPEGAADDTNPITWQWGSLYTKLEVSATFTNNSTAATSTFDYTYQVNLSAGTLSTTDPSGIFPAGPVHASFPAPSGATMGTTTGSYTGSNGNTADHLYGSNYMPGWSSPWYLSSWSATLSNEVDYDSLPQDAINAAGLDATLDALDDLFWYDPTTGKCNCEFTTEGIACFKDFYFNVAWDAIINGGAGSFLGYGLGCTSTGDWTLSGSYDNSLISESDGADGSPQFVYPAFDEPISFIYMPIPGAFVAGQAQVRAAAGAYHFETYILLRGGSSITATSGTSTGSGTAAANDVIIIPVPPWDSFDGSLYIDGNHYPVGFVTTFVQP